MASAAAFAPQLALCIFGCSLKGRKPVKGNENLSVFCQTA